VQAHQEGFKENPEKSSTRTALFEFFGTFETDCDFEPGQSEEKSDEITRKFGCPGASHSIRNGIDSTNELSTPAKSKHE
jgi:hypothetical protein